MGLAEDLLRTLGILEIIRMSITREGKLMFCRTSGGTVSSTGIILVLLSHSAFVLASLLTFPTSLKYLISLISLILLILLIFLIFLIYTSFKDFRAVRHGMCMTVAFSA